MLLLLVLSKGREAPPPLLSVRSAHGLLLGLTAESQALDTETNEARWDGGGREGVCQTLQQEDHPSLNKQSVTPSLPLSLSLK